MDNIVDILVIGRVVERIITLLSGVISISLGWGLFIKGITTPQSGTIGKGSFSIRLARVGPGIFFAAFGTIIILQSWFCPLQIKNILDDKNGYVSNIVDGGKKVNVFDLRFATSENMKKNVHILNTLLAVISSTNDTITKGYITDFVDAKENIEAWRDALIVAALGNEKFVRWKAKKNALSTGELTASNQANPTELKEIKSWFVDTLVDH